MMRADKAYQADYEPSFDGRTRSERIGAAIRDVFDRAHEWIWSEEPTISRRTSRVCWLLVAIPCGYIIVRAVIH